MNNSFRKPYEICLNIDDGTVHDSKLVFFKDNFTLYVPEYLSSDDFLKELNQVTNQWAALGYIDDDYLISHFREIKSKLDDVFDPTEEDINTET